MESIQILESVGNGLAESSQLSQSWGVAIDVPVSEEIEAVVPAEPEHPAGAVMGHWEAALGDG